MEKGSREGGIIIPHKKLSQSSLDGLLDEFILREGTDYGHSNFSLAEKKEHVMNKLKNGSALVFFDIETESSTIALTEILSKNLRSSLL